MADDRSPAALTVILVGLGLGLAGFYVWLLWFAAVPILVLGLVMARDAR